MSTVVLYSNPTAFPINFETDPKAPGVATVGYGADRRVCFTYSECIQAIGSAFMHHLACEGEVPEGISGTLRFGHLTTVTNVP